MKHVITLTVLLLPTLAQADLLIDGHISVANNDNIGNAVSRNEAITDTSITGLISAGRLFVPDVGKHLVLSAEGGVQQFQQRDGLNNVSVGVALDYEQRLGLGPYTPRVGFSLSAAHRSYRRSIRDGNLYRAAVHTNRRINPALRLQADIAWVVRTSSTDGSARYGMAQRADVFSQNNLEIGTELDYAVSSNGLLIAYYRYRHGEFDATTRTAPPMVGNYRAAVWDPAYGPGWVTYRVDGSSHSLGVEWNVAVGQDSSLGLGYEQHLGRAGGGYSYSANVLQFGFNTRF